jgi:hypothetical protein
MKLMPKTPFFMWLILTLAFAVNPPMPVLAAGQPDNSNHTLVPTSGTGKEQVIYDQVNTSTASQKRAFGGEQYSTGRFERPFDQNMVYLPYLDIVKSTMQRQDKDFIYVTIQVAAPVSTTAGKTALFGLELDPNLDGRSEFLILAHQPAGTEWSVDGVDVWKSSSASNPVSMGKASIPVTGSAGYDVNLFSSGKGTDADLAWVRLSPDKPDTVEIAFRNTLTGGEKGRFVWRPETDGEGYANTLYDLNVNFTLEQAGSPLRDSMFYPLKEVYAVDNTCRVASGYTATGNEPGLCPLPPAPEKPEQHSSPSIPQQPPIEVPG